MNDQKRKNKGGRPHSAILSDRKVSLRFSQIQYKLIESYAAKCERTVSDYIRTMALEGKVENFKRSFPKEAVALIGVFNHIAANVNLLTHCACRGDFLTAEDRRNLQQWLTEFVKQRKQLEEFIKDDRKSKVDS